MRRFGVEVERDGWSRFASPAGGALSRARARSTSRAMRRRRRTSSPPARSAAGRCASRASGARASRATCASPRCWSAWARRSRWARTGSRCAAARRSRPIDLDLNHIPDAAMTAAVLALFADGPSTLRNIGELAREGDRPHRRDGHRAAQARRAGGGGAGLPARSTPPARLAPGDDRHLRRPPHGDVLLARRARAACRCASTIRTASRRPFPSTSTRFAEAGRRHECVSRSSPSTARRPPARARWRRRVARALGFHYLDSGALYRLVALAALNGGIDLEDEAALSALAARLDAALRRRRDPARGGTGDRSDPGRGGAASPRRAWRPSRGCARRCSSASGPSGSRRGWSPTGATWGRSCSPTRALKIFLTASPEARAERRYKQLMEKGIAANIATFCGTSRSATSATPPGPWRRSSRRRTPGARYHRARRRTRRRIRCSRGTGSRTEQVAEGVEPRPPCEQPAPCGAPCRRDGPRSGQSSIWPLSPPRLPRSESFAALFEESLTRKEMRIGEVITAEVVRVDDNFVVVNAGLKSESFIPIEEFRNDRGEIEVKLGDFVRSRSRRSKTATARRASRATRRSASRPGSTSRRRSRRAPRRRASSPAR